MVLCFPSAVSRWVNPSEMPGGAGISEDGSELRVGCLVCENESGEGAIYAVVAKHELRVHSQRRRRLPPREQRMLSKANQGASANELCSLSNRA